MATSASEEGRQLPFSVPHGVGLTAVVAIVTTALTVATMTIYLGGSLKQIDINTVRLERLETAGSPALKSYSVELDLAIRRLNLLEQNVALLPKTAAEIAEIKGIIERMTNDFRSREFWEGLAGSIARINVQIDQLNVVRERGVVEWAYTIQRISTLEAEMKDMQNRVATLRDRAVEHEKEDATILRDRMNRISSELDGEKRVK